MKKASKKEVIINKDEPSNEELLEIEAKNWDELGANPNAYQYLYPNLDDPNFNIKIKNKKEFSDTKYDGTIVPIAQRANELSNAEYELLPQQAFVKNFMSFIHLIIVCCYFMVSDQVKHVAPLVFAKRCATI